MEVQAVLFLSDFHFRFKNLSYKDVLVAVKQKGEFVTYQTLALKNLRIHKKMRKIFALFRV